MKKAIALSIVLILLIGTISIAAKTQREVWVPSPGITCGVTSDEIMFNKAIHSGQARLYKLDSIGDRYYLGVTEEQRTDGGSNGKKHTSNLTYYSLLETDDSFIVLGVAGVSNEYYWDGLEGVMDISELIDTAYYTDQGYEAPYYIINPHDKYTYTDWEEYIDYIFIGSNGSIARISDWCDYGQARYPMIYENKLYTGKNKYYSNSRSYYYYLSDGTTKAVARTIIAIKNNDVVTVKADSYVEAASVTSENGYRIFSDGMSGNTTGESSVKDWWFHYLDNKFSDGRYASGHWVGMGSGLYEVWYDIYSEDGTLLSTGASGFATYASSSFYTSELRAFVINDTKLILALADLDNSWFNEYYRASVVTENDAGIVEVPMPLGKKTILPPNNTDTVPANNSVDFTAEDLTLGFNIKNNIIGTDKFNPDLRGQINTIRLDGIVIVAKEGYTSGKQNVGVTLEAFDEYDYTFGNAPVRLYSNGQYFCWYCVAPEKLEEGTYNVSFSIGDLTVCAVVKVIIPPGNDSAATVVF